ncbi:hypothetical protein [Knoellia sinensis]|nr:hypothetical protein [Knoellia sinensis]
MAKVRDTSSVLLLVLATAVLAIPVVLGLLSRTVTGVVIALVCVVALVLGFREARQGRAPK